jgi:hypothetical protein
VVKISISQTTKTTKRTTTRKTKQLNQQNQQIKTLRDTQPIIIRQEPFKYTPLPPLPPLPPEKIMILIQLNSKKNLKNFMIVISL